MSKYDIALIIGGYILMIIFSFFGFSGGIGLGLGELGSLVIAAVVIPIPFILSAILSIYYSKKYKYSKNMIINILKYSVLINIITIISGFLYKNTEINNVENYLQNSADIVNTYRTNYNIDILSENDFKNINLSKNITIEISNDGYLLFYRYGIYYYRYEDGMGWVQTRRP